jgi:transposase
MLADELDHVVGVDPHRDAHALAIVQAGTGAALLSAQVAASEHGYAEALRLAEREAPGRRAWAIEGTGSYGAGLARFLARAWGAGARGRAHEAGAALACQDRRHRRAPSRPQRARRGEARKPARRWRAGSAAGADGRPRGALAAKKAGLCQLRALLVTCPEPLRSELRSLTRARLLRRLQAVRPDQHRDAELRGTLIALRALARRVQALTAEERELKGEIQAVVARIAPALLDEPGIGPASAAQVLLSWSHHGRFRSEAAFARLAGAAPIPASSGLVFRHPLDPAATAS